MTHWSGEVRISQFQSMSIIFTYQKLYRAYLSCRQNKRKTVSALDFELNFEKNLRDLLRELKNRKYAPGKSICFAVSKPKVREIFASDFRDRIVHHLLVNEIIEYNRRRFIYDSYACLKDKGTQKAIKRLKYFIRHEVNSGKKNSWYIKMDVAGFFASIDQNILFEIFSRFIENKKRHPRWKTEMLWLGRLIIFYRCQDNFFAKGNLKLLASVPLEKSMFGQPFGKGLPIGNYTSQFFANLYLHELDCFIKRELKIKKYLRYVDDFVIIDSDVDKLRALPDKVDKFLREKLKLKLRPKKTIIRPIKSGIEFLGYFVKTDYALVKNDIVQRLKEKMRVATDDANMMATINSYFGHFSHAQSFVLRASVCKKLSHQFEYFDDCKKINLISRSS
ncbi:MAG: reverse transcriptase [Candidatus Moranbacteria bacterium]|nr:reverse transcriptase [Candidatus Moranbacteria bacterium]